MLITITLTLILALTACGKIEPNEIAYRDAIKAQALAQLELPSDTDCELYELDNNEWLLLIEERGWVIDADGIKYEAKIKQGNLSDLRRTK